jgi:hypothetical protein
MRSHCILSLMETQSVNGDSDLLSLFSIHSLNRTLSQYCSTHDQPFRINASPYVLYVSQGRILQNAFHVLWVPYGARAGRLVSFLIPDLACPITSLLVSLNSTSSSCLLAGAGRRRQ